MFKNRYLYMAFLAIEEPSQFSILKEHHFAPRIWSLALARPASRIRNHMNANIRSRTNANIRNEHTECITITGQREIWKYSTWRFFFKVILHGFMLFLI